MQYAFCTEFYHEAISLPALEHGLERGLQLFEQTNANLGKIVAPGGKLYFADIHGVPNETGTRIIINPQAKNMFLELLHWIKDPDTAIDRNYQFSDLADENATYWAPRGEHRQRLAEMVHREKDSTAVDGNVLVEALWRMMLDDEHGSFVDLDEEVHTYFDHDSLMVHLNGAGFKPEDLFVFSDAAVSAFGSKYAGVLTPDPFPPIYTAGQFVKST